MNGEIQGGNVCNCPTAMNAQLLSAALGGSSPRSLRSGGAPQSLGQGSGRCRSVVSQRSGRNFLLRRRGVRACLRESLQRRAGRIPPGQRSLYSACRDPFFSPIETIVGEVERAVKAGHRGINMLGDPSVAVKGSKISAIRSGSRYGMLARNSASAFICMRPPDLPAKLSLPHWKGYTRRQAHCVSTLRNFCTATQFMPYLIFSGMLDRFPRLNWVFAETGLGWVSSVLEACDCEWEKRHLWTEGILTRPSDLFRRQIYVDFWFETVGIQLREFIGIDNILWESDFPHITSTYPNSWSAVEHSLAGVSAGRSGESVVSQCRAVYRLTLLPRG